MVKKESYLELFKSFYGTTAITDSLTPYNQFIRAMKRLDDVLLKLNLGPDINAFGIPMQYFFKFKMMLILSF